MKTEEEKMEQKYIELKELIKRVENEINKTPTGELRNLLSDINIVLQQQTLDMPVANKRICPKAGQCAHTPGGMICPKNVICPIKITRNETQRI